MAGTDIDAHSLTHARQNITANDLDPRIKLVQTTTEDPLIPLAAINRSKLDFVMTNPPFYASDQDMQSSYINKVAPPSAVCTGSANEMICPGGDIGFVSRLLAESLELKHSVQWYTAMLGKMTSLQQIVSELKKHEITNFAVTGLQAGARTKRWAVAWSFGDRRPRNEVARHGDLVHAVLPAPTAQTLAVPMMDARWAGERVDECLRTLDVTWQWEAAVSIGVLEAGGNVWSRAARRKRKFASEAVEGEGLRDVKMAGAAEDGGRGEKEGVALAVKITCKKEEVELRWLRGKDHVVFTSFCGMLKRTLTGRA